MFCRERKKKQKDFNLWLRGGGLNAKMENSSFFVNIFKEIFLS